LKVEKKVERPSCVLELPVPLDKARPPRGAIIVGYFWVSGYLRLRSNPQRRFLDDGMPVYISRFRNGEMYLLFLEVFVNLGVVPYHLWVCFDHGELW